MERSYTPGEESRVKEIKRGKGNSKKKIVRIWGRSGVVYEEPMTEAQLKQFLRLTTSETGLGVAFEEWTIEIVDAGAQAVEKREQGTNSSSTVVELQQKYWSEKQCIACRL
jgi:hypothetical protein